MAAIARFALGPAVQQVSVYLHIIKAPEFTPLSGAKSLLLVALRSVLMPFHF